MTSTTIAKRKPRYECALCGRKLTAENSVYSKFTKQRFCYLDHCKRRPR